MGAVLIDAAIAAAEKLAPVIIAAVEPELAKLLAQLPAGMVATSPASPAVNVEAAVAANLLRAVPAANGDMDTKMKAELGNAIAIYATEHPEDPMQSDPAWTDILAAAQAGWARQGLVVSAMDATTRLQMLYSGIEMYRAGLGVRALAVEK